MMSGGSSFPNSWCDSPPVAVSLEWYAGLMILSKGDHRANLTLSKFSWRSLFAFHLFSSVFISVLVMATVGIVKYSPTSTGFARVLRENNAKAAAGIM